jgi:hypothetical protein
MRQTPDEPRPSEIVATLEVIDATLAGEPVDPGRAELAELVLLVAGERPAPADEFADELDRRVGNRFGATSKAAARRPGVGNGHGYSRPRAAWRLSRRSSWSSP